MSGQKRVLVLGDSFTEWRDITKHSYVRAAEKALTNVEFINLGKGGTDIPDYYLNLVRYVDVLDPDLVLVGLYLGNDLKPNKMPIADPNFINLNLENPKTAPGTKGWQNIKAGLDDLLTLINFARIKSKKVGVVLIPPCTWVNDKYHEYFHQLGYAELGPVNTPVPMLEALKVELSNHNIPYVDVLPELRSSNATLYLENDIHLNMEGQALVGSVVAKWLKHNQILKSP